MNKVLLSLSVMLLWLGCHKDTDIVIREETIPDPPAVQITTRVVCLTDTTDAMALTGDMVVNGYHLDFGSFPFAWTSDMVTDQSYATMQLITTDQKSLYAVRSFVPNDINYHHWVVPDIMSQSFESSQNTSVQLHSEYMLVIPANDLLRSDSTPYTGNFRVEYALLNTAQGIHASIPSHTGVSVTHGTQSLLFDACFYIRYIDAQGLPLYSRSASLISSGDIDLRDVWHFSPAKGCWVPAQPIGQTGEIRVLREGYYAFARPESLVRVEGMALVEGSPMIHTALHFSYHGQHRIVYTSNTGRWVAELPAGVEIEVSAFHACQGELKQIITPTTQTSSYTLSWDAEGIVLSTLKATVRDCEALPVEDQIILTDGVGEGFLFTDAAYIELPMTLCASSQIMIQPLNTTSLEKGPAVTWDAADIIDVGSLYGCEKAQGEFLMLEVAGEQKMYWDLNSVLLADQRLVIENGLQAGSIDFMVYVKSPEKGLVPDTDLNILFEDPQLGMRGYSLFCPTASSGCGFSAFALTHYPSDQGGWIRGHFEGTFWIKTFTPLTAGYRQAKGQFQLMRDF